MEFSVYDFYEKVIKNRVFKSFLSFSILILILPFLFLLAFFVYAFFYRLYIPVLLTEIDLNFLITEDFTRKAKAYFDEETYKPLDPSVVYSIQIDLDLPESPSNKELGMMTVGFYAYSKDQNYTSNEILKSIMMEYKTPLRYLIETIVSLPCYIFYNCKQMQTLSLHMTQHYTENYYHRSTEVIVTVYSKHVELYGGRMKITARFSGLRYLIHYWWISSALFGVMAIFSFFAFIAFAYWFIFIIKKVLKENHIAEVNNEASPVGPSKKDASTMTEDIEEIVVPIKLLKTEDIHQDKKKD